MRDVSSTLISALLINAAGGDRNSLERVIPRIYAELHRLPSRRLSIGDHALGATSLVHEAYFTLFVDAELVIAAFIDLQ